MYLYGRYVPICQIRKNTHMRFTYVDHHFYSGPTWNSILSDLITLEFNINLKNLDIELFMDCSNIMSSTEGWGGGRAAN